MTHPQVIGYNYVYSISSRHKALSGCQSDSFRTCDVSEAFRHVRVPRVYARGVYVTRLLRRMTHATHDADKSRRHSTARFSLRRLALLSQ